VCARAGVPLPPHADAFPDLDPPTRGLVEVESREVDGLIVIGALDPAGAPPDGADEALSSMAWLSDGSPWRDVLPSVDRPVRIGSGSRAFNWKVFVEQFLEGYHIKSTHKDTFFPLQYDDLNVVETFGPNSRITFPYRNIERLRDRPEASWTIGARVTFVYHLFPNVMLATFPDVVVMIALDPVDIDHTAITVYSMARTDVGDRAALAKYPADPFAAGSFVGQGTVEDNDMSAGVQRGLHSGANSFVEFGRHESAIGHFHATLDERLARSMTG